jgi:hypothetical protein
MLQDLVSVVPSALAAFGTRKLTAFSIPSPASNSNCVYSRDLEAEGPKRTPNFALRLSVRDGRPRTPYSAGCTEPACELFSAAISRLP